MPHFGLMEEKKMGSVAGPFQRSRLHLRAARRRLRQGKISAGIVTLYDSLSGAMESYAAQPERKTALAVRQGEDPRREKDLFRILARSGIITNVLDFDRFESLMERALGDELTDYDYRPLLQGVEALLTQLGVLPFEESSLPAEDPGTF